jgi:hypothetical protein
MKSEPDQTIACNLGSTGQLVRRALSPVHCPQRFRDDLRERLIGQPPAARREPPPPSGFSRRPC